MSTPVRIYVLLDPESQEIRYVGKTVKPLGYRFSTHIWGARTISVQSGKFLHDGHKELATQFKVSQASICRVVTNQCWKEELS